MSRTAQGADVDYATIGARLKQRRQKLGLSTRKVAEMAKVARYTLLRIESGKRFDRKTMEKVRIALGVFKDQLVRPFEENRNFAYHRAEDSRWIVSVPKASYQRGLVDEDPLHVDDAAERKRLGELGFQWAFATVFNSERVDGCMEQGLMEIHQPSRGPQVHRGEEFLYCLKGQACITVDGVERILNVGDAICFDASIPHAYAPGHPLKPKEEPPLLLVVVAILPDKSGRRPRDLDKSGTKRIPNNGDLRESAIGTSNGNAEEFTDR